MNYIKVNSLLIDNFAIFDEYNSPITGLNKSNFSISLLNPNGEDVAESNEINIKEVLPGIYEISFIPNMIGHWLLQIKQEQYYPIGKIETYKCVSTLWDDMGRIIGLCQENYRIFDEEYDPNLNLISCTIKIYANASDVDTDTNPIAIYEQSSTFDSKKRLTSYKVKRVS